MTEATLVMAEPSVLSLPTAPMGARWETFITRPKSGDGQVAPVLVWTSLAAAVQFYGSRTPEGGEVAILKALDAQGIRIPLLDIIRRGLHTGKSLVEIAQRQIEWNPVHVPKGPRPKVVRERKVPLATTPRAVSRRARKAVEEVGGVAMRAFLERVLSGEIKVDDQGNVIPATPTT